MWPFDPSNSEPCDHNWMDKDVGTAEREEFDYETGEFEWRAIHQTWEECINCGKKRNKEKSDKLFTYKPSDVEVLV